jgi:P4 family phage/plasmid primase-like protien
MTIEQFLERVEQRNRYTAKKDGRGWLTLCPAHDDYKPSLKIDVKGNQILMVCRSRGCDYRNILAECALTPADLFLDNQPRTQLRTTVQARPDNVIDINEARRKAKQEKASNPPTLTFPDFVAVKKLPEQFLREHDVRPYGMGPAGLRFAYTTINGRLVDYKQRDHLSLPEDDDSGKRMGWPAGKSMLAYLLPQILAARKSGVLYIGEGESDPLTCVFCGLATIGLPGSTHWKKLPIDEIMRCACGHVASGAPSAPECASSPKCKCSEHTAQIKHIVIVQDNDPAGEVLTRHLLLILKENGFAGKVSVVHFPEGVKDASELWSKHVCKLDVEEATAQQLKSAKAEFVKHIRKHAQKVDLDDVQEIGDVQIAADDEQDTSTLHGIGNMRRLLAQHGDSIRFAQESEDWLDYDGQHWNLYGRLDVEKRAQGVVRRIYDAEVSQVVGEERKKALFKHYIQSNNATAIKGILSLASPHVSIHNHQLDTHSYLVNFTNGLVDLRTAKLLPHDPKLLITRLLPVDFDPKARCPLFEKFMDEIFEHDQAMVNYVLRAAGYSLSGVVSEKLLFFLRGEPDSGKSTLMSVLLDAVGLSDHSGYGCELDASVFVVKRGGRDTSPDVARLRNARIAIISELAERGRLDEARTKSMTGGDRFSFKALYENPGDAEPHFHLWFMSNYPPIVREDGAIFNRIHIIPFPRVFAPAEQDKLLADKLKRERQGILALLVRHAKDYFARGLRPPNKVIKAVEDLRQFNNVVAQFVKAQCITLKQWAEKPTPEMKAWIAEHPRDPVWQAHKIFLQRKGVAKDRKNKPVYPITGDLYRCYQAYHIATGDKNLLTKKEFSTRLSSLGFHKRDAAVSTEWLDLDVDVTRLGKC